MTNEKETIKHAVVKSESGAMFLGKCHADCFVQMMALKIMPSDASKDQDFITSEGRYVTRREAELIAIGACQINRKSFGSLCSEELWDKKSGGKHDYDSVRGYCERQE